MFTKLYSSTANSAPVPSRFARLKEPLQQSVVGAGAGAAGSGWSPPAHPRRLPLVALLGYRLLLLHTASNNKSFSYGSSVRSWVQHTDFWNHFHSFAQHHRHRDTGAVRAHAHTHIHRQPRGAHFTCDVVGTFLLLLMLLTLSSRIFFFSCFFLLYLCNFDDDMS